MKINENTSGAHTSPDQADESLIGHIWASITATLILLVICCGLYPAVIWGIAQVVFPAKANGSLVKKDGSLTSDEKLAVGSALIGQNFSAISYFHPRPSAAGNGYDPTASGGSNLGPLSDKLINGVPNGPATQPTSQPVTPTYDGIRLRTIHYAVDNGISFKLFSVAPGGARTEVPLTKYQDSQGNLNDEALVEAFPHPITDDDAKRSVLVADNFLTPIPGDAVTGSASGLDPHISVENAEVQKARVAAARNVKPEQVEKLIVDNTAERDLGIFGEPGVNVLLLNLALDEKYPVPAPTTAPTTAPAAK
jgi:K+-transporting ATPase ATPase C chain